VKVTARRGLKLRVAPKQARVFLNGTFVGTADDWDDKGGGSVLLFVRPATQVYSLRLAHPGFADLNLELTIDSLAAEEVVEMKRDLTKGTPAGTTGPEGTIPGIDYRTTGKVRFDVKPKESSVAVDGKPVGNVSDWEETDLELSGPAVHDVAIQSGYQKKVVRVLVSLRTGAVRATIKEKL
jgi:hypothetical protein